MNEPGFTAVDQSHSVLHRQPAVVYGFVEALIRRNLEVLVERGSVVELRALGVDGKRVLCGYYNDLDAMARDAASLDGRARGVYFTLNPLKPEVLQRSPNRYGPVKTDRRPDGIPCAEDVDVLCRRWLPVDLDPVRPEGTNATEEELSAAVLRAEDVGREANRQGWGVPLPGLSGNGCHLLFPCDLPADDRGSVRATLHKLSTMFSDENVKLDPAVHNPSRIWKLYGTIAAKGPANTDRPRRRSVLLLRGWTRC